MDDLTNTIMRLSSLAKSANKISEYFIIARNALGRLSKHLVSKTYSNLFPLWNYIAELSAS